MPAVATRYTDTQLKDHAAAKGWLNADGKFKDTDSMLAAANEARAAGVGAEQLDSAFGYAGGTASRWLQENGIGALTAAAAPPPTAAPNTVPSVPQYTTRTPAGIQAPPPAAPPPVIPPPVAPPPMPTPAPVAAPAPAAPAWAEDPMGALKVAQSAAGTPREATMISVNNDMLTSRQLERLLAADSPYLTRARASAAELSNNRGLLNSSIAAGAGEAAAIDAALPIAQSDAGLHANVAKSNADAANVFARDENQFGREGALTAMRAGLDLRRDDLNRAGEWAVTNLREAGQDRRQGIGINADFARDNASRAFTASENAARRTFDAGENEKGRAFTAGENAAGRTFTATENDKGRTFTAGQNDANRTFTADQNDKDRKSRLDLQKDEQAFRSSERSALTEAQQSNNLQNGYITANQRAFDSFNNTIAAIQASDMDPDVKAAQVASARSALKSTTEWLSTLYSSSPGWVKEWSTLSFG